MLVHITGSFLVIVIYSNENKTYCVQHVNSNDDISPRYLKNIEYTQNATFIANESLVRYYYGYSSKTNVPVGKYRMTLLANLQPQDKK